MSAESNDPIVLALTPGEPAGIGPDIVLRLATQPLPVRVVAVADRDMLAARARALSLPVTLTEWCSRSSPPGHRGAGLEVLHVPAQVPAELGRLDARNSRYVLRTLDRALAGCLDASFDAMVTGPVHKGIINAAGIPFTGHTEYLAERTATARVVMLLVGGGMRVALATTHLALRDVAGHIDAAGLEATLRILAHDLALRFGVARPRIAVAGLNPHAGESGYLGREEIEVIEPVLVRLRAEGYELAGPWPADTLFHPARLRGFDAVLAMYHDQGLPVLKYASFGRGVNITLGLPIIRTSVDHGTALELAGSGKADEGSLREAVEAARDMVAHARRQAARRCESSARDVATPARS